MRLFLIRHAQAGDRTDGPHDLYRPLSPKGRRRAEELVGLLADHGITRIVSSPATRCVQTVEPLAEALGLDVEEEPALWEGSSLDEVFALFDNAGGESVAACSHGDIIPDVIDHLGRSGVPVTGRGCEKGSVWVLDHNGRRWTGAAYLDRSQARVPPG